jgi:aminoglycoside phosphotransferase (APT) family kinase protein
VDGHLSTQPMRWAAERLGSPIVESSPLSGGWTSTMLALTTARGDRAVLRLMTNEPWRTHGAELTTREHETQLLLADTEVPAPRTMALDADGSATGEAAHLMTHLPGEVDLDRVDDASLTTLAQVLAAIHDVQPAARPRTYQSWAWPAKYVVPDWAQDRAAWEQAFAILGQDPPSYEGTFLHRDFQPRNVLWTGPAVTGIVDWVETSWGPAWLDVAHCRTNLALEHGTEVADRFGAAYAGLTGREPAPYFDVMDVVGFLPPPGRRAFITGPAELRRLEQQLVSVLAAL